MTHEAALQLRIAQAGDVPALLAMMVDFNAHEQIAWSPADGEAPLRLLLAAPELGRVGLLERDGATLGYFVMTYGFDLEWGGRDAFLTELYLRPEARGRGLAGPALAAIEALARAHEVRALHLLVRPDNTAARRAYARAGFAEPPAAVALTKPLGPARGGAGFGS